MYAVKQGTNNPLLTIAVSNEFQMSQCMVERISPSKCKVHSTLCCGLTTTSSALYFLIDKHCVVRYSLHNESESDSRLRKNKRKKESNALSFLGLPPCITVKVSRNELNHYKNIDY